MRSKFDYSPNHKEIKHWVDRTQYRSIPPMNHTKHRNPADITAEGFVAWFSTDKEFFSPPSTQSEEEGYRSSLHNQNKSVSPAQRS